MVVLYGGKVGARQIAIGRSKKQSRSDGVVGLFATEEDVKVD